MTDAPILIIQMQRMGDLVLSFPLLGWLGAAFPGHPLWVVGEPSFFDPLMPLSPRVTYFAFDERPNIRNQPFHAVINLSHRPEAAALAGAAQTDLLLGPYLDGQGYRRIRGDWQLYRASLTDNNHYNRYHWADLNALDVISSSQMCRTNWPLPRRLPGEAGSAAVSEGRIGLFLGASEPDKHPDGPFWAELTKFLLRMGHRPVLLGGPAEKRLGAEVARMIGAPALNLTGRFSLAAMADFIAGLDLLITPDTGPMHVAVWTGTPVLNLSLGPVNPWETGPFSPGHFVTRPVLDCAGCWGCLRPGADCKELLYPGRVAAMAGMLLGQTELEALPRKIRGLELLRSARDDRGLYTLERIYRDDPGDAFLRPLPGPGPSDSSERLALALARESLSRFWQAWFGEAFGRFPEGTARQEWEGLRAAHPAVAGLLGRNLTGLALSLSRMVKSRGGAFLDNPEHWLAFPAPVRPLSGFLQLFIANRDADKASLRQTAEWVEKLLALPE